MRLADLLSEYRTPFNLAYEKRLLPSQKQAVASILACRTRGAGEMVVYCKHCDQYEWRPMSCGNRSCPSCQNHETENWLNRQQNKLLPVPYFLVTFTVPASLRKVAWHNQRVFFSCLFDASQRALQILASKKRGSGNRLGMTGVLHTSSRRLDFHPHVHFIVPAGVIDQKQRFWKRMSGKYLFNQKILAKVFRAKLVALLRDSGLSVPDVFSRGDWVVNCKSAGSGEPALKYLSRYLYRGIISEKVILKSKNGKVTFIYRESKTKKWQRRTMRGEDFLWLVFKHVLPRSFRRVRDYGFLHGNARKTLRLVQLLLGAKPAPLSKPERPTFKCCRCGLEMAITGFCRRQNLSIRSPPDQD